MAVKVGLVTSAAGAAGLEALPIDSLWTGGHIASTNPSPEIMMSLAAVAASTTRVTVGTAALVLPLYPPVLVAKQLADLDVATGGRVVAGVGVGGEYPQEFRAVGVPVEERGSRADEIIPLLRRLWTGEAVSHRGRHYEFDDVTLRPPPVQPGGPPVVVTGRRPPAMRRAALLGDGWFPYLYSPRRYGESVERIRACAEEAGRDLHGFEWLVWVFVNTGADRTAARNGAARTLGGSYGGDFEPMLDGVAVAGTPDEVADKLSAFVEAGAEHLVLCPATGGDDPAPVLDALFADVFPALDNAQAV